MREKTYVWCPDITLSSEELPSAASGELLFRLCLSVSLNSLFRVSWGGNGVKSERGSIRGLAASRAVDVQGLHGYVTKG